MIPDEQAEEWRDFLGDASREVNIQVRRAAAKVAATPRGTPLRRRLSREVRERERTRQAISDAYASLTIRRVPR